MKRIDVVKKDNEWVAQDSRKRRLTGADTKVEAVPQDRPARPQRP